MKVIGILFAVLAVVLLVALGSFAFLASMGNAAFGERGCEVDVPAGDALDADLDDTGVSETRDRATRTVTYALDAGDLDGGTIALCTTVGDVTFATSSTDEARVVFLIEQAGRRGEEPVGDTQVEARFVERDGALSIAAWRENTARESFWPFGLRATSVDVRVELPEGMRFDVEAAADVGEIVASGVVARSLNLTTDVGDITAHDARILGDADLSADVGDVSLALDELGGDVDARADVGTVTLRVPSGRAYDVQASSDVGNVDVDIGDEEIMDRDTEGPGAVVHARSAGWSSATERSLVVAAADVGDVSVRAE